MSEVITLNQPWLVAVWPGMGHVALSAGYYLMSKLGMYQFAEFSPRELFEVEHVEVKEGLIHTGRLPRSRLFVWLDPNKRRDIVVFIGEAQPPRGKYAFCCRLIEYARQLGVDRVFTFAAMATPTHPEQSDHVFAAATDPEGLAELKRVELDIIDDGNIGGLNGVLLGAAAEAGLRGVCLLGEVPQLFAQLPFPKASLGVLEAFITIAGVELDLTELSEQAQAMEQKLGEILLQLEGAVERQGEDEEESYGDAESESYRESLEPPGLSVADEDHIEQLFGEAARDRSKAYELKRELDRLEVFAEYEDRFLDLFKKSE